MNQTINAWIEATRLRTLPVSIAGVVTALGYNLIDDNLNVAPAVICFVFALLCQIASNFANEYFDFKESRDKQGREGPRRGVTEGDITPGSMLAATVATLGVACILGLTLIYWGGWWLIAAGVAVAIGVFAYSTGPFPLSTNGLGEVAVILFFGAVPVNLTYYVETLQWSWSVAAGSVTIGLLGANVLIINNYRDTDDDRSVGKKTLSVRLGAKKMPSLYLMNALIAMALMFPVWLELGMAWCIVPAITLCLATKIAHAMTRRSGSALTPLLGMTAMLMCLYAVVFLVAAAIS